MNLTGSQRKQFQQALLNAFPSKATLAQMLSFELDWELDAIAGGQDLSEIIFNLIQYAKTNGQLSQLLTAARTQNPGNPSLHDFAQQLDQSPKLPVDITAAEQESELLQRLRIQMLTAPSSRELRYAVYELDKHLALYPNSPDARLLKDELVAAMKRTEWLEAPRSSYSQAEPASAAPGFGCSPYLVGAAVLATIACILFFLFI